MNDIKKNVISVSDEYYIYINMFGIAKRKKRTRNEIEKN